MGPRVERIAFASHGDPSPVLEKEKSDPINGIAFFLFREDEGATGPFTP
jgi:hypothetical protein